MTNLNTIQVDRRINFCYSMVTNLLAYRWSLRSKVVWYLDRTETTPTNDRSAIYEKSRDIVVENLDISMPIPREL